MSGSKGLTNISVLAVSSYGRGVCVSKKPISLFLRAKDERKAEAKTAVFPRGFLRDKKHISILILNTYRALMQDKVGKKSALMAHI